MKIGHGHTGNSEIHCFQCGQKEKCDSKQNSAADSYRCINNIFSHN